MPRCIETYEIYLAALKLGLVIIPSSEMLRTKDLQYRITHGEVKAIVVTSDSIDEFKAVKNTHRLRNLLSVVKKRIGMLLKMKRQQFQIN
ncbi:acetate-CoA ligase [Staphylococcus saprophyticus]|uniref:Acetate-CoA ligase n=1 Tax=Staphylococcus saprophyticus TaxID=29385 RepID=A0A380HGT4_STASA|nr:acetate-CoA ligase [Staphylococcus saprophyticus]